MTATPKTSTALEVREVSLVLSPVGSTNRSQGQACCGPGQDQGQPLGGQGGPLDGQGQDQGQPIGNQDPPLGRQGQAQDLGGLGQAR